MGGTISKAGAEAASRTRAGASARATAEVHTCAGDALGVSLGRSWDCVWD